MNLPIDTKLSPKAHEFFTRLEQLARDFDPVGLTAADCRALGQSFIGIGRIFNRLAVHKLAAEVAEKRRLR